MSMFDGDELETSMSLLADVLYQGPSMESILLGINDFASLILGKNFVSLTKLGKVARMQSVVPGADSDSLAKLGTKPVVCKHLEDACSLLFHIVLPGCKQFHQDMKRKVEEDLEEEKKADSAKLTEELAEMQREVILLQKQVIQLKDEIHAADRSTFSTTVKKELRSYSAVISQNCAAAVAPRRLQTALKRATSPVEPQFDRSKNLMIFGLPEAENEDDASTQRRVTKVFSHLECSPVMTSTTRVGKKMETRPRPIKVTFERREDLLLLLKKAKILRQSESLRTVYLSPDLTREEREDSTRLYQTLKQLRRDNPGRKYWVRAGSIMCDV